MRAVTLWQPWAWAFGHGKLLENRDWTPKRYGFELHPGDPVAIHAGGKTDGDIWDGSGWDWPTIDHPPPRGEYSRPTSRAWDVEPDDRPPTETALGAVVAVARFERLVTPREPLDRHHPQRRWRSSTRFALLFSRADVLATPIVCPGRRGMWKLDQALDRAVREQWYRLLN